MALGEGVNRAHLAAVFGGARTTVDAWVAAGCPVVKRPVKRGDAYQLITDAPQLGMRSRRVTRPKSDSGSKHGRFA